MNNYFIDGSALLLLQKLSKYNVAERNLMYNGNLFEVSVAFGKLKGEIHLTAKDDLMDFYYQIIPMCSSVLINKVSDSRLSFILTNEYQSYLKKNKSL